MNNKRKMKKKINKNVTLYSSHLFILFSSFLQERQPDYMDRPASINGNAQDMQ
jgi:hypothetical protein